MNHLPLGILLRKRLFLKGISALNSVQSHCGDNRNAFTFTPHEWALWRIKLQSLVNSPWFTARSCLFLTSCWSGVNELIASGGLHPQVADKTSQPGPARVVVVMRAWIKPTLKRTVTPSRQTASERWDNYAPLPRLHFMGQLKSRVGFIFWEISIWFLWPRINSVYVIPTIISVPFFRLW